MSNSSAEDQTTYGVERHSIDYVSSAERHGHVRDQGPFWFTVNFQFMSVSLGFVGPAMGLSLGWTTLAAALGHSSRHDLHGVSCHPGTYHGAPADGAEPRAVRLSRSDPAIVRDAGEFHRFQRGLRTSDHGRSSRSVRLGSPTRCWLDSRSRRRSWPSTATTGCTSWSSCCSGRACRCSQF